MIILSIALSSHRLHLIEKVVSKILEGTQLPDKIIINYSEEPFFIDKGIKFNELPFDLTGLNALTWEFIEVNKVPNIGPMRIAIPIIEDYWDSPETIIIFLDDDLGIGEHTVEDLLYYREKLDCVVGIAGYTIGIGKYLIKARYWSHAISEPQKVHILFNGWGTTFKIKHIHKKILEWHKYKNLGLEYTNESFIMACFALKGTDRYVIPTREPIVIYPTENPIHDNSLTMEANSKIIEKFYDVLLK